MKKSHDFYLIPVSILFFLGKNVSRMRKTRYPWYCIDYFNKFNFALIRKCLFFLLGKIGLQSYLKKKSLRLGQNEKLGTLIRFFKPLNFKDGEGNSCLRVETCVKDRAWQIEYRHTTDSTTRLFERRFYSSKWLTAPVLNSDKWICINITDLKVLFWCSHILKNGKHNQRKLHNLDQLSSGRYLQCRQKLKSWNYSKFH